MIYTLGNCKMDALTWDQEEGGVLLPFAKIGIYTIQT